MAHGIVGIDSIAQQMNQDTPLKELARRRGITVGVQADPSFLAIPQFAQFVIDNFDMITPGNQMKWGSLHPQPSVFNFTGADTVVHFAHANRKKIHGHNLCWDNLNPGWVKTVVNKDNARDYLEEHIATVAGRYKGKIDSWDVVNEPIRVNSKQPGGLTPGPWLDYLGPEYIDIAFTAAASADPGALRVLNLDNTEQDWPPAMETRRASLQLVRDLVKRGVPIQAVGLESHLEATLPIANSGRTDMIKQIRDLGLEVLVTELDVNDNTAPGPDDARRKQVANCYYDFLKDVLPVSNAKRVIFWSTTDKDNWYDFAARTNPSYGRKDGELHFPGLLTADFQPTAALAAVKAALA
jgi:endo-1,4-beta-xylanase